MTVHSEHDLREALRAIESTLAKCEKALTSLKPGTAQHTLLTRRIAAFAIAIELLKERLGE
ncbi:hypothetical protein [Brevundimonas sp.]|uniref:hypothetical protein n=1 Tax=Brevundimonas sp. TaxID=1871086 RepID=UPI002FCAC412